MPTDVKRFTIHEGLAEVKTIAARLEKKRQFITDHLVRDSDRVDPLEKHGGSGTAIREAMQSIADLENRLVDIRSAINKANSSTKISIAGVERTVEQWLIWKREVSKGRVEFINRIRRKVDEARNPYRSKEDAGVVVNLDEKKLAEDIEKLVEILGELDGRLSVVNATTHFEM